MIKANDIRVGNWLDCVAGEHQVTEILETEVVLDDGDYRRLITMEPIPLTPSILEAAGFTNEIWARKPLNLGMVGLDGLENLVLGRTGSLDGLPYHPSIEQRIESGMSLDDLIEIRKTHKDITADNCNLIITHSVCLKTISYVHELQNLYYALTGQELQIKLP